MIKSIGYLFSRLCTLTKAEVYFFREWESGRDKMRKVGGLNTIQMKELRRTFNRWSKTISASPIDLVEFFVMCLSEGHSIEKSLNLTRVHYKIKEA